MFSFSLVRVGCTGTVFLVLAGCMSTGERISHYSRAVSTGDYAAAELLVKDVAEPGTRDALCWQLHTASAQSLQNHYDESIRTFDLAEDRYLQLGSTGVLSKGAKGGLSMLSNDAVLPYQGGGLERIFCCLYKGIGYASLGRYDEARVEFNRAGDWQDSYLQDCRRQVAETEAALRKEVDHQGNSNAREKQNSLEQKIVTSPALADALQKNCGYSHDLSVNQEQLIAALSMKDYFNSYLTHIRGIFRWMNGDNARGDLKQITASLPDSAMARRDFDDIEKGVSPEGQAWIYVEDGLGPLRQEVRLDLPLGLIPYQNHILYTGMAFPRLIMRPEAASAYFVQSSKESKKLELITDVDHLVKTEFDIYFRGALDREIVRLVLRAIPQIVLEELSRHDEKHALYYSLGKLGAASLAFASVKADLRSWTALPKRVHCQRVAFTPGETIMLSSDGRKIPLLMPICKNAILVVRYPASTAVPSISVIPFPAIMKGSVQ